MHISRITWSFLALCAVALARDLPALELDFTRVAGTSFVVDIRHAGDGSGRLFLVEQAGRIYILENGSVQAVPFLDIRNKVRFGGEQGLLSIAFAPDFASSGYFYLWYTDNGGGMLLSRFRVGANPGVADPASEQVVLIVPQPFENHNGGRLAFGPDGMLYLGLGDGGSAGDPLNAAQSGDTLLGKLIRIDVDPAHGTYLNPPDNPFSGSASVRNEIWALGLRNPWRISFDRQTGDLYIADVGQGQVEEVNFQPAASTGGANYGWKIMEGSQCFAADPCDQAGLTLPVSEYPHTQGCSVTGGEVYRGSGIPELQGVYLFGDFCSGRIWGLSRDGAGWLTEELADTSFSIATFGADEAGNVYLADIGSGVYRITDGAFRINAGLNDAWVNFATLGQGFFITVFPVLGKVFLAMFTFDTVPPGDGVSAVFGSADQRWLTAFGDFTGNRAVLDVEITSGGTFNAPDPPVTQDPDGTIVLEFAGCNAGTVTFDIVSANLQGVIPIERIALDNVALCEALAAD